MTRIGVLGANGQVGAEVCLLLGAHPGIEVVPISRNRTGSAFLRSAGVRCRHGRATDAREAAALLGDCNLVLHFSRPVSRPNEMRATNLALAANIAACSAPGARLVYFSSQCAHREFRPMTEPASITAYGWEKRGVERMVRRAAARHGKEAWSLRLGHVAGELQTITAEIRRLLRSERVVVPWSGEYPSNVVYTATIVDAVLAIAAGRESAGTYDLLCSPQWSWRVVLEHEAAQLGTTLRLEEPMPPWPRSGRAARFPGAVAVRARAVAARFLATNRSRELGLVALNYLSPDANLKAQSEHFQRRARAEIDRLIQRPPSAEAFTYAPGGTHYLRSLRPTAALLADPVFTLPRIESGGAFAPDLSLAP
jgi:nucleoside-diphosphate-sugar epimerase